MRHLKSLALGISAAVAALIPTVVLVRKRHRRSVLRREVLEAKAKARKFPHHPKPRTARRIARHLAKAVPTA